MLFNFILELDLKLFYILNHFRLDFLDKVLPLFSYPKFIYIFYITTSLFLLFKYSLKKYLFIFLFLIIGYMWVDFSCANILKPLFKRERPIVSIANVYYQTNKTVFLEKPLHKKVSYSFPSNHATNVGFTSFFLTLHFPKFAIGWLLFAILVGFSRIYLGVHFPLDILTGYLYGFFFAYLFYKAEKFLSLKINGKI